MPSGEATNSNRIEAIPIIRDAFPDTVRLVTTARFRASVLKVLVDSAEELSELAEIEAATSARLVAQDHGIEGISSAELIYGRASGDAALLPGWLAQKISATMPANA